jgi:hypothetical protein
MGLSLVMPNRALPSVVSLSIFAFVFWPLLKNSWPSVESGEELRNRQGIIIKLKALLKEVFPRNIPAFVWACMVIFPVSMTLSGLMFSDTHVSYYIQMISGISRTTYSYQWNLNTGDLYPSIFSEFYFATSAWASLPQILVWLLNLWLGITTLRFINGYSTKRMVRLLASVIILIYVVADFLVTIVSLIWGGIYSAIPLPFYPIAMLLIAKFVHAPLPVAQSKEEMIHVPLGTNISSIFRREKQSQKTPDTDKKENHDE